MRVFALVFLIVLSSAAQSSLPRSNSEVLKTPLGSRLVVSVPARWEEFRFAGPEVVAWWSSPDAKDGLIVSARERTDAGSAAVQANGTAEFLQSLGLTIIKRTVLPVTGRGAESGVLQHLELRAGRMRLWVKILTLVQGKSVCHVSAFVLGPRDAAGAEARMRAVQPAFDRFAFVEESPR